ncbi:MAG: amidohydrolase family protein [Victivallales bacterium]|jgi:predicted TIM-barrel fold metal-dependent hydrolase
MIIDSHLHLKGDKETAVSFDNINEMIDDQQSAGVDKSCLMHGRSTLPCFYFDEQAQQETAENLRTIVNAYPGRFYALLYLNPLLPTEFLAKVLQEYIVDGPLTGVKLTCQMNARDRRLDEICSFIEVNDIPVLWHSWYKTVCRYPFESDPSDIAYFAGKFPGIRILMAHLTAARARGIQDIKNFPNVSIDSSGSQPEDGYMEYALKHIGADRILFGSDYPCRDISTQMGRVESVGLTKAEKEKILCSNALRFFEG